MIVPRQVVVSHALASCSNNCQSPTPNPVSLQNSAASTAVLRPEDVVAKEELKREAERQTLFQKVSNEILDIPSGYRKVEVLIIRWDESVDEFKGHDGEIERLQTIFRSGFGYGCTVARIQTCRDPQIDLNFAILQHVRDHGGENNLLIVYYTGHGNQIIGPSGRRLELSASLDAVDTGGYDAAAFWDRAEDPLLTLAAADVLSILDCCYASTAAVKGRSDDLRTYQLLAASSPDGPANGPGKKSFTTALCDSLEELLNDSENEGFPVIKLWEKINMKRTAKSAFLWDRLQRYKRNIELSRLHPTPERDESFRKEEPEQASLVLRLSLKTDDLSDEQVRKLAQQMPTACKVAGVPVRRMEWVKMEQGHLAQAWRNAVKEVLRRRSSPGKLQMSPTPSESRKRSGSCRCSSSLPPPKRVTRESSSTSEEVAVSGLCTPPRRSPRLRSAESN